MDNDGITYCDKCNIFVSEDEGYTYIDGMDLCDECLEDYEQKNLKFSVSAESLDGGKSWRNAPCSDCGAIGLHTCKK